MFIILLKTQKIKRKLIVSLYIPRNHNENLMRTKVVSRICIAHIRVLIYIAQRAYVLRAYNENFTLSLSLVYIYKYVPNIGNKHRASERETFLP